MDEQYYYHATTKAHRSAVQRSVSIISTAMETIQNGFIAVSGGKDATCVMHLVTQICPDTLLVHADDEWCLPETEAYLASMPGLLRIANRAWHADWFCAWDDNLSHAPDGVEQSSVPYWQWVRDTYGCDGVFLGLRAEENSKRRMYLRKYSNLHYSQGHQMWLCNPIGHWKTSDVWAYIAGNGIPYNQAYERLEEIGVPRDRQRIGPLAVERALGYGQLAILKRGWPDVFNRFAERYPEARSYV